MNEKLKEFRGIKIIDSSTINMAKIYFEWSKICSTKSGIKLHTKFNLKEDILQSLIVMSNAKSNDKTKMKRLNSLVKD